MLRKLLTTIALALLLAGACKPGDFFNGDKHSNCERVLVERVRDDGFVFYEEACKDD